MTSFEGIISDRCRVADLSATAGRGSQVKDLLKPTVGLGCLSDAMEKFFTGLSSCSSGGVTFINDELS